MKKLKNVWKRISVVTVMFLMCWMSALVVLADEEKVVITEEAAELSLGTSRNDGQVRLYTYTIKNMDGNIAGKVELRYGMKSRSRLLWIASENSQQDLIQIKGFSSGGGNLRIPLETWYHYFQEEVSYTYEVSEEILDAINPVKSIRWGEKGSLYIEWNADKDMDDRIYDIRMQLDGEFIGNFQFSRSKAEKSIQLVDYGASYLNKSGNYTASITVYGTTKSIGDSKEIFTETLEYKMPSTRVGTINEIRWKAKSGETIPTIIEWDAMEGAKKYSIYLTVYENEERQVMFGTSIDEKGVTNEPMQLDCSRQGFWASMKNWAKKENVNFEVSVRPLSPNVELIANGEETVEKEYKFYDKVNKVKEKLADVTIESVLEDIDKAGIESVAIAMQTDEEFLEKMEGLEKEYISANSNIKVEKEVEHPALSGDIKVVGAAMNAVSGGAVTLNFSQVSKEQEKDINNVLYTNAVQVNIDLGGEVCDRIKNENVLASPITITMYPPKGVTLSKLVILHYHADGKPERIYPLFRADGKITFSVTKFSTFVFAEMVSYVEEASTPSKKPQYADKDSGSGYVPVSRTGVQSYGTTKKYVKADGSVAKSEWVNEDGKWYYAGADGVLKTGWYQNASGVWYYLQNSCEMAVNWQFVNGKWYYLDSINGDMKTGWLQTADGKWYYLEPKNGDMTEGWQLVNGKWYYLNPNSGDMATGWKLIEKKWYFLTKNGDCLLDTVTPDGYKVDKDGVWIQ